MDGASVVYSSVVIDVSTKTPSEGIPYTVKLRQPKSLGFPLSLSATVNNGWCHRDKNGVKTAGGDWYRSGDYLSTSVHGITISKGKKFYKMDIKLDCPGKQSPIKLD